MNAYIYLENGIFLQAKAFGKGGTVCAEMVFNTSMTGYEEIISDPSYAGQFIVFTMPEIGIVGINDDDMESDKIYANGVIMHKFNNTPSNFRSQKTLEEFFNEQGKFGVYDIDTRYLTKILRNNGSLNAIISTTINNKEKLKQELLNSKKISEINYVKLVSTKNVYSHNKGAWNHIEKKFNKPAFKGKKVAVIDYGCKKNILNELCEAGIEVEIYPHDIKAEILINKFKNGDINGVFLSNGPGEPKILIDEISEIKKLIKADIPMFGICLGHQLLSNAHGYETYKLKFGQHGANHPVINLDKKTIEITSQNHNYNVPESIKQIAQITHRNLFDGTIEGVKYNSGKIFSLQHHPEASGGPSESKYVFKEFLDIL